MCPGCLQLKSSVQKTIKTKIVEQFPLIEGHMDEILLKKEGTRVIKCHEHIEIVCERERRASLLQAARRAIHSLTKTGPQM